MFKHARLGLAFGLALVLAACGEVTTAPQAVDLSRVDASANVVPGTCTNLNQLNTLSQVLFTPSSSPNINSVKGKLKNLDGLVKKGKFADAEAAAAEIVAFTLKKHNQGGLAGGDADVKAFTNAVLCFAGIDIDVPLPDNSFFILPSDQPQVITNQDGNAGINFPANPVTEPTLVHIEVVPDTFPGAGDGPLNTKLDQYPGFIHITKTSETNAPLAHPVTVGVCATGTIPANVRARLRLGHGALSGFEITPTATADFLICPIQTAEAPARSNWDRLADLVLPNKAHAFQSADFGGGVGGTVTEFSPFAPVDPQLEFGGGVGGTVTEFILPGFGKSSLLSTALAVSGPCADPIEGAMGSPLRPECRPFVTIRTAMGTPFIGVPVNWNVTVGGGSVAANNGACGTLGTTAATTTGTNGGAGICWTLGTQGANQVRAIPSLGGDAVPGVTFSQSAFFFDAIANPPAGLVFTLNPAAVVPASPSFPVDITVVDKNGERVFASTDRVFLGINQNTFSDGNTELNLKAVAGVASGNITVPLPGTGYQIRAYTPLSSYTIADGQSSLFQVVPGAPFNILIIGGNGVSATTGSTVTPRVRVVDRQGNSVPGATVAWTVVPESPGAVSPASSVTNAAGEAETAWVIGGGLNFIRAYLTSGTLLYATFSATGTAP